MERLTRLRRPCKRCDEMFTPSGKYQKFCEKCREYINKNKNINYRKNIKTKDLNTN